MGITNNANMSLLEARVVPYPILNQLPLTGRPMGELIDEGLITQRDLEYLMKNGFKANDPVESLRIRKAAQILLLEQVEKIDVTSEIREPATITSPTKWTYSERMQYTWTLLEGGLFGLLVGFTIAVQIYNFAVNDATTAITKIRHYSPIQLITFATITIIGISAIALFFKLYNHIDKKIQKQVESYRKGRIGEELVTRILEQTLDNKWSIYLNFTLPTKKSADMDTVLVGPPGIWVLEVKNIEGQYKNFGDEWIYPNGNKWKHKKNPTQQAKTNAAQLHDFLKADKTNDKFIQTAIVWVNIDNKPIREHPIVPVWTVDVLREELTQLVQQKEKLNPAEIKTINDKLKDLYRRRDNRQPNT